MTNARDNRGVTLVEMLVVLGIIAVLATIIFTLTKAMETQSKERATANVFALLRSALHEYYDDTGSFPPQPERNLAEVQTHIINLYVALDSVPASRQVLDQVNGAFLKVARPDPQEPELIVMCDPWGMPLDYIYVDGAQFPELISAGPDKTFGTNDDISSRGM